MAGQTTTTPLTPSVKTTGAQESRHIADFSALKKSLAGITSWELVSNAWDEGLVFKFSEYGRQAQADVLLQILE
ncbi:MAG: hypothetical protein WC492_04005 [Candidatus Micrarchaeia archaeon]